MCGRDCSLVLLATIALSGCSSMFERQSDSFKSLSGQVTDIQARMDGMEDRVYNALVNQEAIDLFQQTVRADLEDLTIEIDKLPAAVSSSCRQSSTPSVPACKPTPESQPTVVSTDGKILVGELENVWVDPPGIQAVARVDTGAQSSSMHAESLVEFERDGDDWVRFNIEGDQKGSLIERRVERYVRVYQQADKEGSRRPVIRMRVSLGNVQDTFEFTLADRSHLDYQLILGRNFLTDVALVDVAQQFVQPAREEEEGQ